MPTLTAPATTAAPPWPRLGRWWQALLRAAPAVTDVPAATDAAYAWGYAVRREWPDGHHDLFGFTPDARTAERRLDRDRSYWRSGPVRPTAVYLVATNAVAAVDGCRDSSCPNSPERGGRR
ncbi:hypothetical protein AB0875_27225 [Micromonospora gifhornensis]|uniref:hypothetical protein n=1 Tax=Micromonospora gifhornensis TaxID=84594 RepID=UPI003456A2ED